MNITGSQSDTMIEKREIREINSFKFLMRRLQLLTDRTSDTYYTLDKDKTIQKTSASATGAIVRER